MTVAHDVTEQAYWDDLSERIVAVVPPKGRMIALTVALYSGARESGLDADLRIRTVAELADELGMTEQWTRRHLVDLIERGLLAWDEDGPRLTLPEPV